MDGIVLVSPRQIGDTILATPAIRACKRARPATRLTVCCPDEGSAYQLLLRNPYVDALLAGVEASTLRVPVIVLDPREALQRAGPAMKPFAWAYGRQLGVEIDSLRYDYVIAPDEDAAAAALASTVGNGRPIVVCARHSVTCSSNHPRLRAPPKCIDNFYWVHVARALATRGYVPLAIGSAAEAGDARYAEWPGERLYGAPIRHVAALLARSAGVLTVDNGIRHLAVAAGAHVYTMSGQIPLGVISCVPVRDGQRVVEEARLAYDVNVRTLRKGAERIGL